jgi:hypothetical protein
VLIILKIFDLRRDTLWEKLSSTIKSITLDSEKVFFLTRIMDV